IRVGRHYDPIVSEFQGPSIIVLNSFSGGGAQADKLTTENHAQFNDILTWAHGKHLIKAGVNAPDLGRRGLDDRTNRAGTYYFSTLSTYLQGTPFLFTLQRGDGHVAFWEVVLGGFIQDSIRLTPNLTVTAGLRYDWQNYAPNYHNLSPRIALAWAPHNNRRTVVRVGGGIFYDRTGPNAIADTLLYNGQHLQNYVLEDPTFPNSLGVDDLLPGTVRFQGNLKIPYVIQYSAGVERQLHKGTTLSATYFGSRGVDLFRSRDLNAPLPPLYLGRPDSSLGVLREIESAGALKSEALEITLRGKVTSFFDGLAQYRLSRTYDNTGGINVFPANNWDLSDEWSRADTDERHRFNLLGSFHAQRYFTLGVKLSVHSGAPYSLTTGLDDYRDGVANSRPPGVPRNSLQGPGYADLDMRLAHEFLLKRARKDSPTLTLAVDSFNIVNHTNDIAFIGNLSSPFFGRAVAALPARQMQVSLNFKF
ncbi:MAG TPA: TonB-dependent receptor, partial [Candidatus Acidoferrales bacterium]|nr:TonB-dependent receptor [Candidatus Acidoferrales bacterium]